MLVNAGRGTTREQAVSRIWTPANPDQPSLPWIDARLLPYFSWPVSCCNLADELTNSGVMTAEYLVRMLEEMMDLKLQNYAESQLKVTPEMAILLKDKRETDKRRLEQIRVELVRFLES